MRSVIEAALPGVAHFSAIGPKMAGAQAHNCVLRSHFCIGATRHNFMARCLNVKFQMWKMEWLGNLSLERNACE
jgi:hypothetical protein